MMMTALWQVRLLLPLLLLVLVMMTTLWSVRLLLLLLAMMVTVGVAQRALLLRAQTHLSQLVGSHQCQ